MKFISYSCIAAIASSAGCGQTIAKDPASHPSQTPPPETAPATAGQPQWKELFKNSDSSGWRTLRGRTDCSGGPMILDARTGPDVIVMAMGLAIQDGEVEVEILRKPADRNDGPFTISLRLPARMLDWTGVYVVCRPGNVEVCKGSAVFQQPAPEISARHDTDPMREIWRFVMRGGLIDCYLCGKKLLTYSDDKPRSGSICLTASKCRIEVLAVRCKPADKAGQEPREK